METKHKTSFRLSPEALHILRVLAEKYGLSVTAVLEMLVRDRARLEGLRSA